MTYGSKHLIADLSKIHRGLFIKIFNTISHNGMGNKIKSPVYWAFSILEDKFINYQTYSIILSFDGKFVLIELAFSLHSGHLNVEACKCLFAQ